MKNIFIIGLLILSAISCKAQIIPIEQQITYRTNEIEVPDGTYYKDVNNILDKFVGTWIGVYDNKNYEFIIEKIIYQSTIRVLTIDKLLIRYRIINNLGISIADTTQEPNDSYLVIDGNYMDTNGEVYHLDYQGFETECGQNGYVRVAVINNGTQMNLGFSPEGEKFAPCPNGEAEQVLPNFIVLDKL